jgi:hypothetical protein
LAKESEGDEGIAQVGERLHEAIEVDLGLIERAIDRSTFRAVSISAEIVCQQQIVAGRFYKLGLGPKSIVVENRPDVEARSWMRSPPVGLTTRSSPAGQRYTHRSIASMMEVLLTAFAIEIT